MKTHKIPAFKFLSLFVLIFFTNKTFAQETAKTKRKAQITPLPAISYAPETGATIGIIGDYYFDLAKGDSTVSMSKLRLLSTYTTTKQFVFEPSLELYTNNDNYRFQGSFRYRDFNDRNYGLGVHSTIINYKFNKKDEVWKSDTSNYQKFDSQRILFEALALKKIVPNFYAGLQLELDYVFKVQNDSSKIINGLPEYNDNDGKIAGFRNGIGINLTYDTRDRQNYPTTGTYAQCSNHFFTRIIGSDVSYTSIGFDVRQYFNTYNNHVAALRVNTNNLAGGTIEEIPIRGLSRFGGKNQVRGYFFGTYQDRNLMTFQAEYRLPFTFLEDSFLPLLGRLGVVAFFSGGQAYGDYSKFSFKKFHAAAGGGLRVNINKNETTNIRIDYGFALDKSSGYNNKAQSGLYFSLGEAF